MQTNHTGYILKQLTMQRFIRQVRPLSTNVTTLTGSTTIKPDVASINVHEHTLKRNAQPRQSLIPETLKEMDKDEEFQLTGTLLHSEQI